MTTFPGFDEPSSTRGRYGMGDRYMENERKMPIRINYNPAVPNPGYKGSHRRYKTKADQMDQNMLTKETKVTVIKWEDAAPLPSYQPPQQYANNDVIEPDSRKSLFTQQLERSHNLPHYRYMQYAKLDGDGFIELPRKSFKIFMTMLPEQYQDYPLHVCIMAKATIKDLIGLICYKYSVEHPEITLGCVHDYGLCIADDDGEVDWDFPCFDVDEYCYKLGFRYLGLIELKKKPLSMGTLLSSDDEISLVSFREDYYDQRQSNNSRLNDGGLSDIVTINENILTPDALQYCTYEVHLLRRLRTNLLVHLSISPDMIEITPLTLSRGAFWNRTQFFMHRMDTVAQCKVLGTKGKITTFRIIYSQIRKSVCKNTGSIADQNCVSRRNMIYQYHDFIADQVVAKKIIEKLNTLLNIRNSACRREFRQPRESRERVADSGCFPCAKRFWFS